MFKIIYLSVFLLFFITGCNIENESNHSLVKPIPTKEVAEQTFENKVNDLVKPMKEVKEIKVIGLNRTIMVALELNHYYTLQTKKITKKITKKLEDKWPEKEIIVTTDHKIFIELEKLDQQMKQKNISKNDLNKKLNKLKKLLKEQT